jgi:hypothetical protein
VLASALAGVHPSIDDAVDAMVRPARRIKPDSKSAKAFDALYDRVYRHGFSALKPLSHRTSTEAITASDDRRGVVSASLLAADAGHLGDAASDAEQKMSLNLPGASMASDVALTPSPRQFRDRIVPRRPTPFYMPAPTGCTSTSSTVRRRRTAPCRRWGPRPSGRCGSDCRTLTWTCTWGADSA